MCVCGTFNRFPDFFCTGISNCCRFLKIQYVIVIHFMRWLTKFYDFTFKWTTTAAIGIHTTKAWLSQLVNFKNAIWTWGHFRRTSLRDDERWGRSKEVNTPQPPYSPDLTPCDVWLFPKLTGCRYETIEEMKEAVTKVIDTLTQEDFRGAFQKLLEWYNKCIAAGGDYFEGD